MSGDWAAKARDLEQNLNAIPGVSASVTVTSGEHDVDEEFWLSHTRALLARPDPDFGKLFDTSTRIAQLKICAEKLADALEGRRAGELPVTGG